MLGNEKRTSLARPLDSRYGIGVEAGTHRPYDDERRDLEVTQKPQARLLSTIRAEATPRRVHAQEVPLGASSNKDQGTRLVFEIF